MADARRSLREMLSRIEDPRDRRGPACPLTDVLMLAVYGMLCGKSSLAAIARHLKRGEAELTEAFGLARGVPSHDVFYRNRWEIGTRSVIGPVGIAQRSRRVRISHRPYGQSFGHRMWPSARTHVCKYWYTR